MGMTHQSAMRYTSQSVGMINDKQELSAVGSVRKNLGWEGWWGCFTKAWCGLTAGTDHRTWCHQLMFVLLHPGYQESAAHHAGIALPLQITAEQMCFTPGNVRKDARYYVNIKQPTATISLEFLWEWGKRTLNTQKRKKQLYSFFFLFTNFICTLQETPLMTGVL